MLLSLALFLSVRAADDLPYPPALRDGSTRAVEQTPDFLIRPEGIPAEVTVAREAPRIELALFPGQDYPGKPWSTWGESLFADGRYYASFGDHLALGNAFIYEYTPETGAFRRLLDLRALLQRPEGHYTPGKFHSRLDLGVDGWLYASTHRGSTQVTTDAHHYEGDWIVRCHPATGETEIVAHAPVPKHCLPCGTLDGRRLIFHAGTAPGDKNDPRGIQYVAYDVKNRKLLHAGPDGPARCILLSARTGRVYFNGSASGRLRRWDPARGGAPETLETKIGMRAASSESADGRVFTVSEGGKEAPPRVYAFDTAHETAEELGVASVGSQGYITAVALDPTGRYLYYVPGAHGGADRDGGAVVQFDLQRRTRKVLAFPSPVFAARHGLTLKGTYSLALSTAGDTLYITWNASRGSKAWDCVALTALRIPASER